jgi:hypothetical protein
MIDRKLYATSYIDVHLMCKPPAHMSLTGEMQLTDALISGWTALTNCHTASRSLWSTMQWLLLFLLPH